MNDRPQGGSAFNNGTIELMINRRGNTSDGLGNAEVLNETIDSKSNIGIRTHNRFCIDFTNARGDAIRKARATYLRGQNQLMQFTLSSYPKSIGVD
jgi:hypothetical protein